MGPPQIDAPMLGTPPTPPIVSVNSWDNHEVHIQVHNDFRKRQEFESLDPKLKDEFEKHVELHRAALGLPPTINPEQMQQIQLIQATQQIQQGGVSGAPISGPSMMPAQGQPPALPSVGELGGSNGQG